MRFLTNFADLAVILPLVLAVVLVAAVQGWWRGAFACLLAVSGALVTLLVLKLAIYACGPAWPIARVHSPSGHTGSAAVAGAGVAVLLGLRWTAVPLAALVAAGIGVSRVALRAHTPGDVLVGGAVGVAAAAVLVALVGPRPRRMARWPLAAVTVAVLATFHGQHLRVEHVIRGAAITHIRGAVAILKPGLDKS